MESPQSLDNNLSLHDFLTECELQQYFGAFRNRLKVATVEQLKYVHDSDFDMIGMSRPEQRRLLKLFHKLSPQSYIGRMKKIINTSLHRRNSSLGPEGRYGQTPPHWNSNENSFAAQIPPLPARRRRQRLNDESKCHIPSENDCTPSNVETSLKAFAVTTGQLSSETHTQTPQRPPKRRTRLLSFSANTSPAKCVDNSQQYHTPQISSSRIAVQNTETSMPPSPLISPYADFMSVNTIGSGQFSTLSAAVWHRPNSCDADENVSKLQVAIKRIDLRPITLQIPETSFALDEFLRRARQWHSLNHAHLIKLYALSFDNESETTPNNSTNADDEDFIDQKNTNIPLLVLELAPMRSLLECLKEPSLRYSFPIVGLCELAGQVCSAMAYLEAEHITHNNLCLNNVMVFTRHHVKVTDIGLLRASLTDGSRNANCDCDNVHSDRHQRRKQERCSHRRPTLEPFCYDTTTGRSQVAWLAPELVQCLRVEREENDEQLEKMSTDKKSCLGSEFTHASDAYAFGTTLWEMFSYGAWQSWPALSIQQILNEILPPKCARLDRPDLCSVEIYEHVMLPCWQHVPEKRPNFFAIQKLLYEYKPQQVEAVRHSTYTNNHTVAAASQIQQKNLLFYRRGDVITVLDKKPSDTTLWYGALASGKCGLFDPSNTAAYMHGLSSKTLFDMNNTSYYAHKQQQLVQTSFVGSRNHHVPRILSVGRETRTRCNSSNAAGAQDMYGISGNIFDATQCSTPVAHQSSSANKSKRSRSFHNPLMLRRTGSKLSLRLVNAVVGGLSRSRSRLGGSTCRLDAATTPDVINESFYSTSNNNALSFQVLHPARSVNNLAATNDHMLTSTTKPSPGTASAFSPASRCQSSIDSNVPKLDFPTRLLELLNMTANDGHSTRNDDTIAQQFNVIGNNNLLNLSKYFQSDVSSSTVPANLLQQTPRLLAPVTCASVVAVDNSDSSSSLSSSFRSRAVNKSGEASTSSEPEVATVSNELHCSTVIVRTSDAEDVGRKSPACDSGLTTSTNHTQKSSSSSSSSTSSSSSSSSPKEAKLITQTSSLPSNAVPGEEQQPRFVNKTMVTDLDNLPAIDDGSLPWNGESSFLDNGTSLLDEVFQALEISANNYQRPNTQQQQNLSSSADNNHEPTPPNNIPPTRFQTTSRSIETPLDSMVSTLLCLNYEHERTKYSNPRQSNCNSAEDGTNIPKSTKIRPAFAANVMETPLRKVSSSDPSTIITGPSRSNFYYPSANNLLTRGDQTANSPSPIPVPNTSRPNHSLIKTCQHFSLRVASSVSAAFANGNNQLNTRLRRNNSRLDRAGSVESSTRSGGIIQTCNSSSRSSPRLVISQPTPYRTANADEDLRESIERKPSSFASLMSQQLSEKQRTTKTTHKDCPSLQQPPTSTGRSRISSSENRRAARLAALQLAVGGIATRVATTTASKSSSEESDVCLVFDDEHQSQAATDCHIKFDADSNDKFVINEVYDRGTLQGQDSRKKIRFPNGNNNYRTILQNQPAFDESFA